MRWKSKEECLHVKYAIEYEEHFKKKAVIGSGSSGNPIKDGLQHAANDANFAKTIQMSVIFHILSRGHPMRDFLEYSNLLSFLSFSLSYVTLVNIRWMGNGKLSC